MSKFLLLSSFKILYKDKETVKIAIWVYWVSFNKLEGLLKIISSRLIFVNSDNRPKVSFTSWKESLYSH